MLKVKLNSTVNIDNKIVFSMFASEYKEVPILADYDELRTRERFIKNYVAKNFTPANKSETPKYRLKKEGKLFRLVATRSFADIKEGDLGGLVSSSRILSHSGDCWIDYQGIATGKCRILNNARVSSYAMVSGEAIVAGDSVIESCSYVSQKAFVYGQSIVKDNSSVVGYSEVNNSKIDSSFVTGISRIENASLSGATTIYNFADGALLRDQFIVLGLPFIVAEVAPNTLMVNGVKKTLNNIDKYLDTCDNDNVKNAILAYLTVIDVKQQNI